MGGFGFWEISDFYRAVPTGIAIIRVLHGARDIDLLLETETFPE